MAINGIRVGFFNNGKNACGLTREELLGKIATYRDVEPTHRMSFEGLDNLRLYQRGLRYKFTHVDVVDTRPNRGKLDDEWIQYIKQVPFTNNTLSEMFGISVHMVRKYKNSPDDQS